MRLILAAGTTETALIDGISAAGASPEAMAHTPAADVEIVVYGEPTTALPPVSPTGCPTPAAVTRAAREVLGFEVTVLDAGLAEPTDAPTVSLDAEPGVDVQSATAVPDAEAIHDRAAAYGRRLPDGKLLLGETIPGGTTTALGVLRALGVPATVSSSLPRNPLERKRAVVSAGLTASDLDPGECAGDPHAAIRAVGDPVQAAVAGVAAGALETGTEVTLAGGTQMLAVAALLRHAGIDVELSIATTSFVADDVDGLAAARDRLDCDLVVTDPGFDRGEHVAMARYCAGEAKEGVGMGGALSLAAEEGDLAAVRKRFVAVCDRLGVTDDATEEAAAPGANGETGEDREVNGRGP